MVNAAVAAKVYVFPLKLTVGTTLAVPRTVEVVVSVKVTVPVGPEDCGEMPVSAVTVANVAVNWSANPELISVAPAARVGVRLNGVTVIVTGVAVAGLKVASPEYDAPMTCVPPGSVGLWAKM